MPPAISRNAPCPCGSGLRYKHCCGADGKSGPGPLTDVDDEFAVACTLHQAGNIEEAERLYRRLLDKRPGTTQAMHYLGVCRYQLGDLDAAVSYLRGALARNEAEPLAYNNLGLAYLAQHNHPEALTCFDKAIAQDPGNPLVYNNRGLVLHALRRFDEALLDYRRALELDAAFAEALANQATTLHELKRYPEAAALCQQTLAIKPDIPFILGDWLHNMMQSCDWGDFAVACRRTLLAVDQGGKAASPFTLLPIASTAAQQQRCARTYIADRFPARHEGQAARPRHAHHRLRLGYFSADFHNHATMHLLAELFERHDRTRFELTAFSFGPPTDDPWRRRATQAFDRFLDVRTRSDAEIAGLARELEIDIAVDLKGLTQASRAGLFALRPAAVQVNYLGFPGTLGASYIDYILADRILIPPELQACYDEKIVYLPHTYMVNDTTKVIAQTTYSRSELGLPEKAFVFCCFNGTFKITPDLFAIWMRLLHAVAGSVLWLFESNVHAVGNLRQAAATHGIAPHRLVFAPRLPLAEHLARHRQADLFLDTFYCNAHTTACDALWAGLPVLTCLGETFAARVAASLLAAIGLPELVTRHPADYEALALALAREPGRLAALRRKLEANKLTQPLFDTPRFTRNIETAYQQMHARQQAGLAPDHLIIEDQAGGPIDRPIH